MKLVCYIVTLFASLYSISMYAVDDILYPDDYMEDYSAYVKQQEQLKPLYPTYDLPLSTNTLNQLLVSKRQSPSYNLRASKRATLNQLLQRLVALYGNHDIAFSGRSSHVRFGAGGR